MTITSDDFTWNPEEIKEQAIELLQRATEEENPKAVRGALYLLVRLYVALDLQYPKSKEMDDFKTRIINALRSAPNEHGLFTFIAHSFNRSGSDDPGYYRLACEFRSVIQIFCDEFVHVDLLLPEPDRGDIEQIDELLAQPRIFDEDIDRPYWAPASHWWWTAHNETQR